MKNHPFKSLFKKRKERKKERKERKKNKRDYLYQSVLIWNNWRNFNLSSRIKSDLDESYSAKEADPDLNKLPSHKRLQTFYFKRVPFMVSQPSLQTKQANIKRHLEPRLRLIPTWQWTSWRSNDIYISIKVALEIIPSNCISIPGWSTPCGHLCYLDVSHHKAPNIYSANPSFKRLIFLKGSSFKKKEEKKKEDFSILIALVYHPRHNNSMPCLWVQYRGHSKVITREKLEYRKSPALGREWSSHFLQQFHRWHSQQSTRSWFRQKKHISFHPNLSMSCKHGARHCHATVFLM